MREDFALSFAKDDNGFTGLYSIPGDAQWRQCKAPDDSLVFHKTAAQAEADAAHRLVRLLQDGAASRPTHRIRHCEGNRDAWCLIALRSDGTEIDSFGGYTTAFSIDSLLRRSGGLLPGPDDRIELVYYPQG